MNANTSQQPGQAAALSSGLDDPRVVEALEQYLAAIEAGERPNRQAFLARHAAIAEALAECLEGMEALHEASASPHQLPAETGATGRPVEWQPGTPLGDFRIIREVGRGGMGVVYEAEQLSLGRRIALKVLPFALTLDPRQLQRFKNEARAAAHLHHQNIVPVYAVGCERGVHFYAMQYIEGQTLAEVIQELRQAASTAASASPPADTAVEPVGAFATAYATDPALFFRTVARLGVQAAEALEHAHQYGVVHRDMKPGNLLVDVRGHLWVADFGLAQFQSEGALTLTGDLLGTLRYMSPEQALAKRGLVDHRADVYSLGATLYELLTLEAAYGGRDREELLRQIAFGEPRAPRRCNPAVPADLETIVLKAMSRGVDERYGTARELAEGLRRFLEYRPIRARRPTLLERGAKWSRRHKAVVVTVVALLLLAAVGFAASTALVARAQWKTEVAYEQVAAEQARTAAALERERQRAREADEQRARAERSFQQAREAVEFLTQVSEEELAGKRPLVDLRRRLLEAALVYYQDFIDERRDDPSSQEELAAARARVVAILGELSAWEGFGRVIFLTHLLGERAVQEDLRLSQAQVERARELTDGLVKNPPPSLRTFRQFSPETRRKKLEELTRSAEHALADVLTPGQAKRLKQVALQQRGAHALSDPEVAEALGLTAEQKEQLRAIQDEARKTMRGPPWAGEPPAEEWRRPDDHGKSISSRVLRVLTAEQKACWDEMIGEPLKGEIGPAFRGPFGPGRDFPRPGRP